MPVELKVDTEAQEMAVCPSPDGKLLAASWYFKDPVEDDLPLKFVGVYSLATGKLAFSCSHVRSMRFTADSTRFIGVDRYNGMYVYDTATGKELWKLRGDIRGEDYPGVIAPNGTIVLHRNNAVQLVDHRDHSVIRESTGHNAEVERLAFSPDGKLLASMDDGRSVRIWDLATLKQIKQMEIGRTPAGVAFTPESKTLLTVTRDWDAKITRWDVVTGKSIATSKCDEAEGISADLTRAAISRNTKPQVVDVATRKTIALLDDDYYHSFAFSADGKLVAGATDKNGVAILDAQSGKRIRTCAVASEGFHPIYNAVFSSGGKYVAGGGGDEIVVWDVQTGKRLHRFETLCHAMNPTIAFTADERYMVGPAGILWDVETGKPAARLKIVSPCNSFAFDPKSRRMATGHEDGLVILWDLDRILPGKTHL